MLLRIQKKEIRKKMNIPIEKLAKRLTGRFILKEILFSNSVRNCKHKENTL